MLGLSVSYKPRTIASILAGLTPNAQQPESIPWMLYDTQKIDHTSAATTAAALSFFTSLPAPADKTLTNMPIAGALPNPWYFEIQKVYFDVLGRVTTDAATLGAYDNIEIVTQVNRGVATFNLSDKQYGPFPLTCFGRTGGATGIISSTVATVSQQAANVADNGGFPMNGALTIPPQTQISWVLNFSAQAAISVDTFCRMTMAGILYRRVS
jgi:hypothetical protein